MALVFKIKHEETLRRWVISQTVPEKPSDFTVTVDQLEGKIREIFHIPVNEVLLITYVDKEGDIITVADDQDLVDACLLQCLNPLRLDVQVTDNKPKFTVTHTHDTASGGNLGVGSSCPQNLSGSGNTGCSAKAPFPQVTTDAIKQFLSKYTQAIDPHLQPALILKNIHQALKDFVKTLVHEGQRLVPHSAPSAAGGLAFTRCASEPPVQPTFSQQQCYTDKPLSIVHVGVKCDGCSAYPIRGLRYKSTKVFNYDLCSRCFEEVGNEADYQKIERPVCPPQHGFYHPSCSGGHRVPEKWVSPFASGVDGWKSECPFLQIQPCPPANMSKKLDARFVKDMTVFDGSMLAPCTQFTKVWRLKNVGSMPWPQGTQLAHLGGHKLAVETSVNLKLPEDGLPLEAEFDVSVDMQAPDTTGFYISHWCLRDPSGERFGNSVWVGIQVTHQDNEAHQELDACVADDKVEVVKEESIHPKKVESAGVSEVQMSLPDGHQGLNVHADESIHKADQGGSYVPFDVKAPPPKMYQGEVDSASDDVDGFSMVERPVESETSKKMQHEPCVSSKLTFSEQTSVLQEQNMKKSDPEIAVLELQLHLLETMGFANRELNAVLLQKNNQDLQLTLDDLLLGSGWDSLLKDLQDMGFNDTHTNLRLLIKNEGSIKRVVKELVEMEKLYVD